MEGKDANERGIAEKWSGLTLNQPKLRKSRAKSASPIVYEPILVPTLFIRKGSDTPKLGSAWLL
jgi:hypothetical protein